MIDDSVLLSGLKIEDIRQEIDRITENINLSHLTPRFVFFGGRTNTLEMYFGGEWNNLSSEEKNKVLNCYKYGLRAVLGEHIRRVAEFKISKELLYV